MPYIRVKQRVLYNNQQNKYPTQQQEAGGVYNITTVSLALSLHVFTFFLCGTFLSR